MPGVKRVVGNMCMLDMKQTDKDGASWVKKPTAFLTNADGVANRLAMKCQGMHRHITLIGGRAKAAEVYPDKLCREIVTGLIDQMQKDRRIIQGGGTIAEFDQDQKRVEEY